MATATKKSIGQRILAAQGDVHILEKESFNEHARYNYVSHDAYMEAARPILNEHGIVPSFNQLSCVIGTGAVLVECELLLINADDIADVIASKAYHLQPFQGKDAARPNGKETGAAYSYCAKYLISKALMMSSGEDIDADEDEKGNRKPAPKPKAKAPKPKAKAAAPKKATPKKAAKKRTPSLPPSEVDEDGEYEAIIPDEAWDAVRDVWHARGTISEKQVGRLFAIARNEGGWEGDAMKAELEAGLGIGLDDLPWGDPYNEVINIFTQYSPDGGAVESDDDEGVDDEDPDSDIPF